MGAFAQSLGQTLGQAGSDYGTAVNANLETALGVIQSRLMNQELQQRVRESEQRAQEMALRVKQMGLPIPEGTVQTPQGLYGITFDPNKGQYGGAVVQGSQQFFAPPSELSDDAIQQAAQNLPQGASQGLFTQTLKGYRDLGMYPQALALMGVASKGLTKPAQKTTVPDKSSPTGWSSVEWDIAGNEISRVPIDPGTGREGSVSVQKDEASGLTTTTVHTPNRPPNADVPPPNAAQATTAQVPSVTAAPVRRVAPQRPAVTPPKTTTAPTDTSGIPWLGAGKYSPQEIKKLAEDWRDFGKEPEGKIKPVVQRQMAAHNMTPGEKGAGTLTPQAERVLLATDPVLKNIDSLRERIERLGLQNNNQNFYLTRPYIDYLAGKRAPINTLGDEIAGFSLGSVIEATSALQGGSRALRALEWAKTHTPNVWLDSPSQMYKKLADIRQRLEEIDDDAKTIGQKGLRFNQQGQPIGGAPSGVTTITPEDMKEYMERKKKEQK